MRTIHIRYDTLVSRLKEMTKEIGAASAQSVLLTSAQRGLTKVLKCLLSRAAWSPFSSKRRTLHVLDKTGRIVARTRSGQSEKIPSPPFKRHERHVQ